MSEAAALAIVEKLQARGRTALFAGGCVRDRLLGRAAQDYDVATDAVPEEVMTLFPRHSAVGAHFGVVLVHAEDGSHVEVATFRTEGAYSDRRHPDEVRYTRDPREDVQRRDFTINGMLFDPVANKLLDFVGGRQDLERQIVRTIGDADARFREDLLRMMRAVRFAARFGFNIEVATMAAIRRHANEIVNVSRERVRDELLKMLTEGRARRAFELLDESGLLAVLLPQIAAMKGVQQPPQFHPEGDVWVHTLMMLEGLEPGTPETLALGVLLHDVGKPPTFRVAPDRIRFDNHAAIGARMAEEICARFCLSREQTRRVTELVENHMRFRDAPQMRESTLKRFLRLPRFDDHLELHRLDCLMSHGNLDLYEFVRQRRRELPPEAIRPARLFTGNDLLRMGYPGGPRYREILEAIEDAQLEGRLRSPDEAEEFVRREFPLEPQAAERK
jgi:poly(A) polymerase